MELTLVQFKQFLKIASTPETGQIDESGSGLDRVMMRQAHLHAENGYPIQNGIACKKSDPTCRKRPGSDFRVGCHGSYVRNWPERPRFWFGCTECWGSRVLSPKVRNCILTSCQSHKVISGRSNSVINQYTFYSSFPM